MKVEVKTLDAGQAGDVELNEAIFGLDPRADILHRVVTWQLEKRRAPARATRERSDVARTGKKFGRQKGGGVARHAVVEPRAYCHQAIAILHGIVGCRAAVHAEHPQ